MRPKDWDNVIGVLVAVVVGTPFVLASVWMCAVLINAIRAEF